MKYLDLKKYDELNEKDFQNQVQYPWIELSKPIKQDKFKLLIENLPDIEQFEKSFGKKRKYGQTSHDRFIMEYNPNLNLPEVWKEFIKELHSKEYKDFIKRMFGFKKFDIRFHWHYTTNGCSVSPHCDGNKKIGSQIFYLNTDEDWKVSWGGQTLVLLTDKNIPCECAPKITEFRKVIKSTPINNNSFIFARTDKAWHAVDEIKCPEDKFRKIFIVVIDKKDSIFKKIKKNIYLIKKRI